MLGIKKAVLPNKTMDVLSIVEFGSLINSDKPILDDTCVQVGDYVYPVTNSPKSDTPWIMGNKNCPIVAVMSDMTDEQKKEYSADNIVDFSSDNVKGMSSMIQQMDKLKNLESTRLSIVDNVLVLPIHEEDSRELQSIKEAINAKKIDADSYKSKFPSESDFNNDMRALKSESNHNISFFKAKRILNAFDMKMSITISDKEGAVNPMGEPISSDLIDD